MALSAGVDLVDIKEPNRGALGRADRSVIAEVVRCVSRRAPVSAALGELRDADLAAPAMALPEGVAFAKLGLAGCGGWIDWPKRWAEAMSRLPSEVARVAVAYADWRACGAPSPEAILRQGGRLGCGAALLDTCQKEAGGLFDHCRDEEVAEWIAEARRLGLLAVIAGSLTLETAGRAAALGPDYIAVRGAACRGSRSGPLDAGRIGALRMAIAHRQLTTDD